jgi:Kef-type K+ transport system membrane component KefB
MSSVPYQVPNVPSLLTLSSFLYLINVADYLSRQWIHAGLVGPLVVGIVYGSQAADILSASLQTILISLGYIGLLLIVFEAGLSTNISLLYNNLLISLTVAMTGVFLPIALSLLLLHFGYGYSPLQSFAAGAALCSTSVGTTLSLLDPSMRQTRVGSILMSAALIDDITGLVIAAIITHLSSSGTTSIPWQAIVRPIFVSFAFALVTPFLAWALHWIVLEIHDVPRLSKRARRHIYTGPVLLSLIVAVLSGFVAGAQYAGTSELFGAYLAGVLLSFAFQPLPEHADVEQNTSTSPEMGRSSKSETTAPQTHTPQSAFEKYIVPPLTTILSPIFFASIGSALPIRSLGSVNGSHSVVWRGILYSVLMVLAKFAVGVWIVIWPERRPCIGRRRKSNGPSRNGSTGQADIPLEIAPAESRTEAPLSTGPSALLQNKKNTFHPTMSRMRSAFLLGIAMVARGEIALIVAQLARPLLVSTSNTNGGASSMDSEPFAVVIWAILVSTVGGAIGVGLVLRTSKAAIGVAQ